MMILERKHLNLDISEQVNMKKKNGNGESAKGPLQQTNLEKDNSAQETSGTRNKDGSETDQFRKGNCEHEM